LQTAELASLAGAASGSAARSLYGGFAELRNAGDDIEVSTLRDASDWPLRVVVAITTAESKPVSSGEAMELSRKTSPFYENWVNNQDADLDAARRAVLSGDFPMLATVAEHNCLKMHSVMWASRPAIVYWNSATLNCLQTIRALQSDGVAVFFTIDAGPQVKAVCLPEHESDVRAALTQTDGVTATMVSGLGQGARMDSQ
jgi:diphosphomevalonate decarboxylase